MKVYDVVGVCNALVDILIEAKEHDIKHLGLTKGVMHLVESDRQDEVIAHFDSAPKTVELGGSAMNAIRTLASLGKKTVFAGMVSADLFGQQIRERMAQLRILARLGEAQEPTGSCVILVTPDGERTMNTNLGASRLYTEVNIPHDDIAAARILHFCGYQWDTDGQKRGISEAITTAKDHETLVSFDVADPFVVSRYRKEFIQLIEQNADIVFANREEASLLYESSPEEAAQRIAATGAIAVIKLGAEGALVQKGATVHKISPVPTKVVDTTAAGDMFAAGFLYGLTEGKALDTCGAMAATVASDVISRMGASVSEKVLTQLAKM